jgi:hypothetical protein
MTIPIPQIIKLPKGARGSYTDSDGSRTDTPIIAMATYFPEIEDELIGEEDGEGLGVLMTKNTFYLLANAQWVHESFFDQRIILLGEE